MAGERIVIGQFFGSRKPDTAESPLAPGGSIDVSKSFLEQDLIRNLTPDVPGPPLFPAILSPEPPPPLGAPAVIPMMPAPPTNLTREASPQPSLPITLSAPPADPVEIVDPPRTSHAGPQPSQFPQGPTPLPPPPAVVLSAPALLPSVPGHVPVGPAVLPPAPAVTFSSPAVLPDHPGFQPSVRTELPSPPEFVPTTPAGLPTAPVHSNISRGPALAMPASRYPDGPGPVGLAEFSPDGRQIDPSRANFLNDPAYDSTQRASLAARLGAADAAIKETLHAIGDDTYSTIPMSAPGGAGMSVGPVGAMASPFGGAGDHALDPFLFAKSVARLGAHLGKSGLLLHAAEQTTLFAQNVRGRVWNPLLAAPPPLLQSYIKPSLEAQFSLRPLGEPVKDIHLEIAQGVYRVDRVTPDAPFVVTQTVGRGGLGSMSTALVGAVSQESSLVDDPRMVEGPLVDAALKQRNLHSPDLPYSESAVMDAGSLADAVLENRESPFLDDGPDGLRVLVSSRRSGQKILNIFQGEGTRLGGSGGEWRHRPGLAADRGTRPGDTQLGASAFVRGVIPVKFKGDNEYGFTTFQGGREVTQKITDDEAYVPLSFTDLRPVNNVYRTVYFRPFITNFSEDLAPSWNKANYFGRADAVAGYQSTGRSVSLGFKIVAFGPEDVRMIYAKLNWLASMVYPEYDSDLVFRSGPVVRLRVGDVINAIGPEGGRGLPGIIENLSFDYNDSIWELKRDLKVPRTIQVSLQFTILHDRPIGRGAEGRFGGLGEIIDGRFLPPGARPAKDAGGDSDLRYPDVRGGVDSFRSLGGARSNDMNYDGRTLSEVDQTPPEPNRR